MTNETQYKAVVLQEIKPTAENDKVISQYLRDEIKRALDKKKRDGLGEEAEAILNGLGDLMIK